MSCVPTLQRESIRLYLLPGLEENDLPDNCEEAAPFCPAAEHDAASASSSGPSRQLPNGAVNDDAATAQAAGDGATEVGVTDDDTAAAHGTAAEDGMTGVGTTAAAPGAAAESSSNSQSGG